jgi:hypothetical protein
MKADDGSFERCAREIPETMSSKPVLRPAKIPRCGPSGGFVRDEGIGVHCVPIPYSRVLKPVPP